MADIIGNTTATSNPQPDWNQTDSTKADYIKNKPGLVTAEGDKDCYFVPMGANDEILVYSPSLEMGNSTITLTNGEKCTIEFSEDLKYYFYISGNSETSEVSVNEVSFPISMNTMMIGAFGVCDEFGYINQNITIEAIGGDIIICNGKIYIDGEDGFMSSEDKMMLETHEISIDNIDNKIIALESQVADILYSPISITSFTHNAGTKEMGSTVTDIILSWTVNKTPDTLTLDGETVDVTTTNKTINGLSITWDNNKTWTLEATDDREATDTKTTAITFCNNIYYGVGIVESGFNSAFVTGLSKKLQTAKAYDFTASPTNQYIYYAVPERLGAVTFKVGGFEGGFEAPEIVSVTNSSNYAENYYVYRSTNKITGSTSVDVI